MEYLTWTLTCKFLVCMLLILCTSANLHFWPQPALVLIAMGPSNTERVQGIDC